MTLDTQMTPALLQELLMALRENNADGYKSCSYSVLSKLEGVLLPAVLSLGMGEARKHIF